MFGASGANCPDVWLPEQPTKRTRQITVRRWQGKRATMLTLFDIIFWARFLNPYVNRGVPKMPNGRHCARPKKRKAGKHHEEESAGHPGDRDQQAARGAEQAARGRPGDPSGSSRRGRLRLLQ